MTVRVGFLGGGFIARYHLGMLRAASTRGVECEVVGVVDPDEGKSTAFAAAAGCAVIASEDRLIEMADAVYVCTWTAEHLPLVARVAGAGKAVFCEKPLATSLADARELCESVRAAGVVNQVGLVLRDSPSLLWLQRRVVEPGIAANGDGDVLTVVFRDDQYLPTQGQYGSIWRGDPQLAGAGTLLEHSIHDLDVLEWVCGPVAALSAVTNTRHGITGIEDLAVVSLRFASGAVGTLTSIWHDHLGRESGRRIEVFRDRAVYTLEGDLWGPVWWSRSPVEHGGAGDDGSLEGRSLTEELSAEGVDLRNPDAGFVKAVAAGTPAYPDVTVALRAHVLVDAAYRSAGAGGEWLEVPAPA